MWLHPAKKWFLDDSSCCLRVITRHCLHPTEDHKTWMNGASRWIFNRFESGFMPVIKFSLTEAKALQNLKTCQSGLHWHQLYISGGWLFLTSANPKTRVRWVHFQDEPPDMVLYMLKKRPMQTINSYTISHCRGLFVNKTIMPLKPSFHFTKCANFFVFIRLTKLVVLHTRQDHLQRAIYLSWQTMRSK